MPGDDISRIKPGGLMAMVATRCRGRVAVVLMVTALTGGCGLFSLDEEKSVKRPGGTLGPSTEQEAGRRAGIMQGTIGSVTTPRGNRFMLVRGYGLVTGLNGRGSAKCPPSLRQDLVREIRRSRSGKAHIKYEQSPEEVIDSLDTAVVIVDAKIPAGATKGRRFDVGVRAADEDTKSLAGGVLLPCELKILAAVSPQEIKAGRTHATASGRVFVNPFGRSADSATVTDPHEGRIIGGGRNVLDRRLGLMMPIESYATVRQIMDVINRHFGGDEKVADAISPTNVTLTIPPGYRRGREGRFLQLVQHLPLSSSKAELEARTQMLVGESVRTDAPLEDVTLSLEGMGTSVLPLIQPRYTHSRRPVNYYAARTGLRLGDALAIDVMIRHAKDSKSPFRFQAIRELGDCQMQRRASAALRALLTDEDTRIRICAYEALRRVDRDALTGVVVGREPPNFLLEIVPSEGPPMIYVRQTGYPRIALIGGHRIVCKPPLLYSQADKTIILSANADDRMITVLMKEPGGMLGPYEVPMSVAKLTRFLGDDLHMNVDGTLQGLGLGYSVVLDVLYRLYEKKAINATMRWEEPSIEELIGVLEPMGRSESEL